MAKNVISPDPSTVIGVLTGIRDYYGLDILKSREKLTLYFEDMAPNMQSQFAVLQAFVGCDGPRQLSSVLNLPQQQADCLNKMANQMASFWGIPKPAASEFCLAYWQVLSGQELSRKAPVPPNDIPPKDSPRKDIPPRNTPPANIPPESYNRNPDSLRKMIRALWLAVGALCVIVIAALIIQANTFRPTPPQTHSWEEPGDSWNEPDDSWEEPADPEPDDSWEEPVSPPSKESADRVIPSYTRPNLAVGNYHSVFRRDDGTVMAYGSAGLEGEIHERPRCDVWDWEDIVTVSASSHTVGLKEDRTVVAVGLNKYGQCNVDDWYDIIDIDAGNRNTIGLKSDGTVRVVGNNDYGQLDAEYEWSDIVQVTACEFTVFGLTSDGRVLHMGQRHFGSDWTDIVAIDAGAYHLVGLKSDGTVVQAGYANEPEWDIGDASEWTDIVAISAGAAHTLGLKSNGDVVCCGSSKYEYDRMAVENWHDIVEIGAGMFHSVGVRSDGSIVATGDNRDGRCDIQYHN